MTQLKHLLTVIITGAGGTYGLGTIANLRRSNLPLRLIGVDSAWNAAGLFQTDTAVVLPPVNSPAYEEAFVDLCRRENVSAVFITSGVEIRRLAGRREELEKKSGTLLILNSEEIVALTSDKLKTAESLAAWGFSAPLTALASSSKDVENLRLQRGFPLIAKPRFGKGSHGIKMIQDIDMLSSIENESEPYVIQEFIGDADHEYTAGVVGFEDGNVLGSIVLRRWLKAGQTMACETDANSEISAYVEAIAAKIKPRGYLNIQLRLRDGSPCAFEINGRVSSSTAFRGLAGFNEPDLILRALVLKEAPERPRVRDVKMVRGLTEWIVDEVRWKELVPS